MIPYYKKTSIIATLGPASYGASKIERLIRAGADVFRINFSHGNREEHDQAILAIRNISRKLGLHVGILCDLQGPKIRTGNTENDRVIVLKRGTIVELTSSETICDHRRIFINYHRLHKDILLGQSILINDGSICLKVTETDRSNRLIRCKVIQSGTFSSHQGVNFPQTNLRLSSLTKKDIGDLAFALSRDIDFIALSFVRHERDMRKLSKIISSAGKDVRCIAKLEKPEAVGRLSAILASCDGIMVARGDLGVETSPAKMPILQKDAVQEANRQGKLVIVATQMLESMVKNSSPTRAETTDVANAILDGTDAIMLSGETSVGMYPVESVKVMVKVAVETEKSAYFPRQFRDLSLKDKHPPHAICEAANWASRDLGDIPVIVFTLTGESAHYLSKIRCQSKILAFTPSINVARSLSLSWNVVPFLLRRESDMLILQKNAEKMLIKYKVVKKGELVILLCGKMLKSGATNLLEIKRIGETN